MINFFKKLLEKRRNVPITYTCMPIPLSMSTDSLSDLDTESLDIDALDSENSSIVEYDNYIKSLSSYLDESSSEVSYDSDMDVGLLSAFNAKSFQGPCVDPFIEKLNNVAELKRQLCFYRDMPFNKKWFLYYALDSIEKIGFYPPGMPYSKSEVLDMVFRHQNSLKEENVNIAPYIRYLSGEDCYKTFELIAKSPVEDDKIYSMGSDEYGQTLLHHAVRWNNYNLAKKLLELEFCPNFSDDDGKTPIYGCVGKLHHRKSHMAELLIECGANPYHKLQTGKTLLDKAIQKGNVNLVIKLVTKYGFEFGPRKNTFQNYPEWAKKKLVKYWLS